MSTLKVNTIEEATSGGATYFTAKAWVNIDGTGSVSIRADGGVSSLTDVGTGIIDVNFSPSMADALYGAVVATNDDTGNTSYLTAAGIDYDECTTSKARILTNNSSGGAGDRSYVAMTVTR